MRIECYNIGKVESANIDVSKITLIAGLNSSGKSTIGKALYCIFNSMYHYEEKIIQRKKRFVYNQLVDRSWRRTLFDNASTEKKFEDCIKRVVSEPQPVSAECIEHILKSNVDSDVFKKIDSNVINNIKDFLNTDEEEFIKWILLRRFKSEFGDQILNLNNPNQVGMVKLDIQRDPIDVKIVDNAIESFSSKKNLRTRAIYIDDPFVLDNIDDPFWGCRRQEDLADLIKKKIPANYDESANAFFIEKKLNRILEKLSLVWNGDISRKDDNFSFFEKKIGKNLDVKNLSTGLKAFIIIKILLLNGTLEQNGTLILDEPEVHLHPEWQKIFAEIIVLIQIEFSMHVLINSHSAFFIEAIETYEKKYGIRENCKFYLAEEDPNTKSSKIRDVSDQLQPIFELLYIPLEKLMKEQQNVLEGCGD
jgi:predicted ATPase